jgi:hypothetical protein
LFRIFPGTTGACGHTREQLVDRVIVFFVGFGVIFLLLALVVALGLFFAVINLGPGDADLGAGLGAVSVGLALFGLTLGYASKIVAYLIGVFSTVYRSPSGVGASGCYCWVCY